MVRNFPAELSKLGEVLEFVDAELEKNDCTMKAQTAIDVALEEMFVNIAHYAYPNGEGSAEVDVSVDTALRTATVRLADSGVKFNPLAKTDPDTEQNAEERPIGGLGIFMVKKMMDEVAYSYDGGRNIFTMMKHI